MTASQLESSTSNESKTSGRGKTDLCSSDSPGLGAPPRRQQRGPPRGSASLGAWGGATLPRARALPFPCGLPPGSPPGCPPAARSPRTRAPAGFLELRGPRGARLGAPALALRGCGVSGAASARGGRRGPRGGGGAEREAGRRGWRRSSRERACAEQKAGKAAAASSGASLHVSWGHCRLLAGRGK